MKRTIYAKLIEWKTRENKKPLVIKGARQIGKTWIVKEFGKNEYKEFVYVNCDSNERVRELFEHDFNINRIIRGLSALSGKSIQKRQTLIFFDEVQEIPRIVQSLKYFYENEPEYHVIVAGSLLGIHEHSNISFPVGKIETLNMYPLSFQEFILSVAGKEMYKLLSFADMTELNGLHSTFVEYLRQYYFTGSCGQGKEGSHYEQEGKRNCILPRNRSCSHCRTAEEFGACSEDNNYSENHGCFGIRYAGT